MSRLLRDFALRLRSVLGGRSVASDRVGARGVILMFHQILKDDAAYERELRSGCTAEFLDCIVLELRSAGWDVVSLDQAVARLTDQRQGSPFAVLTFDDGYRDLLHAVPILERHNAPFTAYAPTGALTHELDSWWLGLRALIQSQDKVVVAAMDRTFDCAQPADKLASYAAVRDWVHQDYRRAGELSEIFRSHDISLRDLNRRYFLTPAELSAMAKNPLATIGAHSVSHAALSTQDRATAERELNDNRRYLELLCDRHVDHFAFPYGSSRACSQREFALAKELSFRTAVTTLDGPLLLDHANSLHSLPRLGVSGTRRHVQYVAGTLGEYRNG